MSDFTVIYSNDQRTDYAGPKVAYSINDAGVLTVTEEDGWRAKYSPHAWVSVREEPRTGSAIMA